MADSCAALPRYWTGTLPDTIRGGSPGRRVDRATLTADSGISANLIGSGGRLGGGAQDRHLPGREEIGQDEEAVLLETRDLGWRQNHGSSPPEQIETLSAASACDNQRVTSMNPRGRAMPRRGLGARWFSRARGLSAAGIESRS